MASLTYYILMQEEELEEEVAMEVMVVEVLLVIQEWMLQDIAVVLQVDQEVLVEMEEMPPQEEKVEMAAMFKL